MIWAAAIQADSADPAAIKRSVDEAVSALGGLDILVKNAGIALYDTIADFKIQNIDALLVVNVRGPVLANPGCSPPPWGGWPCDHDRLRRCGSHRRSDHTVYYMTKAALRAYTRGRAHELGPRDITANLVQPGSTNTETNPADGGFSDFQRGLIPLGRFGAPSDAAATVAFLASPAACQITGTIVNVDGGLLA